MTTASSNRVLVVNTPERLTLSLPAPRHWFTLAILTAWQIVWAIGLVATLSAIFGPQIGSPAALFFAVAWLLGWCGAGLFSLYIIAWMLNGREIVTLDRDTLTIRRDIRGRGRDQRYRLAMIAALRADDDRAGLYELATSLRLFGLGNGKLHFDYSGLDYCFGAGLSRGEADAVAALLDSHPLFPEAKVPQPA